MSLPVVDELVAAGLLNTVTVTYTQVAISTNAETVTTVSGAVPLPSADIARMFGLGELTGLQEGFLFETSSLPSWTPRPNRDRLAAGGVNYMVKSVNTFPMGATPFYVLAAERILGAP